MAGEHLAHLRGWCEALRAAGVPIDALPERMGLMASLPGRLPG